MRRTGDAGLQEVRLLHRAVLAHGHRSGGGRHHAARGQRLQRLGRHVLEFGGDGVALARQLPGAAASR
jgi:hypothetical protein